MRLEEIPIEKIIPSPDQARKKLRNLENLSESIGDLGLIEPLVTRTPRDGVYTLIAGERRWRAAKTAGLATLPAIVKDVTDSEARRMTLEENVRRDDLTPMEEVDAWIRHLDAELWQDKRYRGIDKFNEAGWGNEHDNDQARLRARWLLMKLKADVVHDTDYFVYKFIHKVEEIFAKHPRKVKWRSFLNNDVPLLDLPEPVQEIAIEKNLNKSQAKALGRVAEEGSDEAHEILGKQAVTVRDDFAFEDVPIEEASAREIRAAPGTARRAKRAEEREGKSKVRQELARLIIEDKDMVDKACRLFYLGWTQGEIQAKLEIGSDKLQAVLDRPAIEEVKERLSQVPRNTFFHMIEKIVREYKISIPLTWAFYLDGMTDEEKMEKLDITIKKYNVWNYTNAHKLMGDDEFSGRIPGQIVANTLYWFTNPGDRIIDPMAGSGTTPDACLLMGRECYAYDLYPMRYDIIKNDIRTGYPESTKCPDFIFVDPPYWNIKTYNAGNEDPMTLEEFYQMLEHLAQHSYDLMKDDGQMGVLMGNQAARKWLPEGINRLDHVQKEYEIFTNVGFEKIWGIWVPMPTQGAQRWARAEWDAHRMGEITRELTIWQK